MMSGMSFIPTTAGCGPLNSSVQGASTRDPLLVKPDGTHGEAAATLRLSSSSSTPAAAKPSARAVVAADKSSGTIAITLDAEQEEPSCCQMSGPGEAGEVVRLVTCSAGIVASFLFYGYVLEAISTDRHFPEVAGILVNSIVYVAISRAAMLLQGQAPARVHARQFLCIALSAKVATFLTWRALRYVSFPSQVLAKSCKALPIMAVNRLAGKKHSWTHYISVSLITGGVVMFMLFGQGMDSNGAQANTLTGAVVLLLALGFDGVTGHLEDVAVKEMGWKHGQGTFDLMLQINIYAIPLCLAYIAATDQVAEMLALTTADCQNLLVLSFAGAAGQICIFYTIANFGAVTCSLITTLRKMLQLGVSAVLFGHTFMPLQLIGIFLSFSGGFLNMRAKRIKSSKPASPAVCPPSEPQLGERRAGPRGGGGSPRGGGERAGVARTSSCEV